VGVFAFFSGENLDRVPGNGVNCYRHLLSPLSESGALEFSKYQKWVAFDKDREDVPGHLLG
jgi:hypothetical protein